MLWCMPTVWKLKAFLHQHRITANALADRVKGQLSKTAIYNLVGDTAPTGINFVTLDILIPALTTLTRKPITLHDLLEYLPDPRVDWRSHFGYLNKDSERQK